MSTRDISASNITASKAGVIRPILFSRMSFASGVKRFHTEIGPRTAVHPIHGSESYTGIGDFGGMSSDVTESVSNAAQQIKVSLTGIDSSLLTDVFTDDYHGRDIEIMLGFDDVNGTLTDDPVILYSGFMDNVNIVLSDGRGDLTLNCESRAIKLQGNSDLRFTDEQLQSDYTGDLAGEYIFRMMDIQLKWGDNNVQTPHGLSRWGPSGG